MTPRAGPAAAALYKPAKPTLFDVPLSNHGARVRFHSPGCNSKPFASKTMSGHACTTTAQCRYVIYKKELESEVDIVSPKELGGLGSEQYRALSPEGKMPLLVLPCGTALPESEVCAAFSQYTTRFAPWQR